MKKIIFSLLVIASSFTTNLYAQDKTPGVVVNALQENFSGIKQASWAKVSELYKAEFIFGETLVSAFFDADGDLVATGRDVETTQLPIDLQIALAKNYKGYNVTKSFEVDMQGEVTYYLMLDSSTKKLQLQSTSFGWEKYQKPADLPLF
jgi:hypothetical protein